MVKPKREKVGIIEENWERKSIIKKEREMENIKRKKEIINREREREREKER